MLDSEPSETSSHWSLLLFSAQLTDNINSKSWKSTFSINIAGWDHKSSSNKTNICYNTKVNIIIIQIWKNSSGGKKTWERLFKKSTDKPIITTPAISKTQSWSFKTSSTDTSTPVQSPQWNPTPKWFDADMLIQINYKYLFNLLKV